MDNIEILEDMIKKFKELPKDISGKEDLWTMCKYKHYKAIENLIQENKELKKQIGKDLDVVYIKGVYDERDKWKNKIKELREQVHSKLDNNAITRGYQIIIDEIFSKFLEEGE